MKNDMGNPHRHFFFNRLHLKEIILFVEVVLHFQQSRLFVEEFHHRREFSIP